MNSVQLVGRMVADPEIKYSDGGNSIARFRVAVDRRFKKEGQPDADFISCKAFGKSAEFIEKYFFKGMRIGLIGSIQTGSYTNKDGQTVYTTEVVADNVEFVESKQQQEQAQHTEKKQTSNKKKQESNDGWMNVPEGIDEALPFN